VDDEVGIWQIACFILDAERLDLLPYEGIRVVLLGVGEAGPALVLQQVAVEEPGLQQAARGVAGDRDNVPGLMGRDRVP